MTPYLIACLVVALPALLWRRCGPLPVRIAGVVTALVVAVGVLDPRRDVTVETPATVRVVPTSATGVEVPELAALRATITARAQIDAPTGSCGLVEAVAGAILRDGGQRRLVPVVIWTGPFAVPTSPPPPPSPVALSLAAPPPIEPDDCRLAAIAPLHVERPAVLEVHVVGRTARPTCRLQVRDPAGAMVAEQAGPVPDAGPFTLAWTPAAVGAHRFALTIETTGSRIVGEGVLDVAPARLVRVIGASAAAHAAALRVQGHRVEAAATLPASLEDTDVLVLLDRLATEDQQRVATFVDGGGGAFFVGAADGGAFPHQGEPLHALLPVNWTPPPPPAAAPRDGAEREPEAREPPSPPPEPKPEPPKVPSPGDAATGKTGGATAPSETEIEVERRSIAMVLVIDRSGSMEANVGVHGNRMDYAKRSAYETAVSLEEGDEVAVVTFGVNGQIVLPLTPATDLVKIRERVEGLRAVDAQTLLEHALRITREQVLTRSRAAVKHVVVITDGEIFDLNAAHIAARKLRQSGATVSLIKILSGEQLYKDLPDLARLHGGGEFYAPTSAERVPALVSSEVMMALGRVGRGPKPDAGGDATEAPPPAPPEPPQLEPEPTPLPDPKPVEPPPPLALAVRAVTRSPLLDPPPDPDFPGLAGILAAAARPEARVLLVAGDDGNALLTFANRGLGKVGAWSADFLGDWGKAWRADADFPGRLSAWIASLAPPAAGDDRNRLAQARLEPPAPVRAERAFLEAWSGAPLATVGDWQPPAPARRLELRSLARECAGAGVLVLLLLALFEFAALRRGRF